MKPNKYFLVLAACTLLSINILAQDNKDMTKDEWQQEMNQLTEQKASLTKQNDELKNDIASLTKTRDGLQTYDDCVNGVYAMLGTDKAGVDDFRNRLSALSSNIDARAGKKADLQAQLDAMKKNKISALPEFFDEVHSQLQSKLDVWIEKPKEMSHTVVRGDCLWNIAKEKDYYANAFAWPVIYKSNRDQIKNPDLIYPKQIFKIPYLSDEEQSKYDKIRRNYKPAPPTESQQSAKR